MVRGADTPGETFPQPVGIFPYGCTWQKRFSFRSPIGNARVDRTGRLGSTGVRSKWRNQCPPSQMMIAVGYGGQ